MADQGGVRWNPDTQSWDSGGPGASYTPPPPPRPEHAPGAGVAEPALGQPQFDVSQQWQQQQWQQSSSQPETVGPGGGSRPWFRRQAVITSVAAAVLAAGVGGYLLWGRGEQPPGDAKPAPSAVESPTDTGTDPSPAPEATEPEPTESGPPTPPAGYRAVAEGEFSLAVPESWEPRTEAGQNGVTVYFYEQPGGPERIQVFRISEENPTPMGTLKLSERDLKRLPGYERNSLGPISDPRGEAAQLDYSYESEDWDGELRTLVRILPGAPDDPTLWAVLSVGPAEAWPQQRVVAEDVAASFAAPPPTDF
ncbi:hypothetical protein [Streptomyces boluensis]|uniref:Serine/arginine repetitive matrix protein 2 n=1 Tax=Streptomyces boluensis TaxID=1775135 RepID=A0A964UTD8_9ACTN|nr:hypothetical protein [Streptomyces boluensis]NBE54065.1 hypothetical protein [Streptomyces boluensis]